MSDNAIKVVTEAEAERLARQTFSTIISAVNAEGETERYSIAWRPRIVWGVMLGEENMGRVPIVWADDATPPAYARRSAANGSVYVKADQVQVTGQGQQVVEGRWISHLEPLSPGGYVIRGV